MMGHGLPLAFCSSAAKSRSIQEVVVTALVILGAMLELLVWHYFVSWVPAIAHL